MKKKYTFFLFFLPSCFLAAVLTMPLLFSGCYTLKQGTTMLGYLGKAVPLEKLEKLKGDESEEAAFARQVADIRHFAMEVLGLKASKNYTRYVELDRDYLAAVVSACAADSFPRHEWKFPIVGSVPYKGFFNIEDAKKEAAKQKSKGLDVWVRSVDAFSTLGWFKDPLYSYMKDYSVYYLAELIIHELFHATVFVKGRVEFNEQLAEFVGTHGARLYIEDRFGIDSPEYQSIGDGENDNRAFRKFLSELGAELESLYSRNDMGKEEKISQKEEIIKTALVRFEAEYESRFQDDRYRGFSKLQINNAYLDLYRLYHEEDNFFADLYEKIPARDNLLKLQTLIQEASGLNKSREAKKDPKKTLEYRINQRFGRM